MMLNFSSSTATGIGIDKGHESITMRSRKCTAQLKSSTSDHVAVTATMRQRATAVRIVALLEPDGHFLPTEVP